MVKSIQVGRSRHFRDPDGKEWTSGIVKEPVAGVIFVTQNGIRGDEQADRIHHGGPDKAVLAYSADHFLAWQSGDVGFAGMELTGGSFGENLTVVNQAESDVCIGDIIRVGSCRLQISQPRQPCWKLSRRWSLPKLAVAVQRTGRTGWYCRVLDEGSIQPGDRIELIERPYPDWSVAAAHAVMHAKPRNSENDLKLADCKSLSESWRKQLRERAFTKEAKSSSPRLFGQEP